MKNHQNRLVRLKIDTKIILTLSENNQRLISNQALIQVSAIHVRGVIKSIRFVFLTKWVTLQSI